MRVRAPSQNKIKRKTRSFCCSRLKNEEMKDERRRQNEEKRSEKSFFKTVVVVSKKEEKDRNFDTLKPAVVNHEKKRRITANILTFGRDKRCGKRGFGSRTVFSIQLFVETKLFTFASRLNSRKSLRNFESEEEPCRRRLKRASTIELHKFSFRAG